jgi:hypothetical protein
LQEVIVEDYDNFCDEFCGSEYNVFKPMWHGDV